nr:MAG TPA: hypothetical protein [Caudoviricetes sp.]
MLPATRMGSILPDSGARLYASLSIANLSYTISCLS